MPLWSRLKAGCRDRLRTLLRGPVEDIIADLAPPVVENRLNFNALSTRLMELDLALRNINHLAARAAAELHPGLTEKVVAGPVAGPHRSKLCTERDFDSDWLAFWAGEMNEPLRLQRKLWEFCFIAQALYGADM